MLQSIKGLLFGESEQQAVVNRVDDLPIATCVVLLEIALADDEFTDDERAHITSTMENRFGLSHEDANELIEVATKKRDESRDIWHFTNVINNHCSQEEKLSIVDEVWHVVFADGSMDGHENYLAHQMAKLFNLTHGQLIDSKVKVLEKLRGTSS